MVGVVVVDGGDAPSPTATEFQEEGNAACDRLTAEIEALEDLDDAEADRRGPDAIADFRKELEDIGAPAGGSNEFARLMAGLRAVETASRRAAEDPDAEAPTAALSASAAAVQALGLTRCEIFEGANRGAHDRLAQSELRNAFAAEKVYFTDEQRYTDALDELRAIEPNLQYADGTHPERVRTIYVNVNGDALYLSARSATGLCFYLRDAGAADVGFASDVTCSPAEGQQYAASW
jgi:hypothetical protein